MDVELHRPTLERIAEGYVPFVVRAICDGLIAPRRSARGLYRVSQWAHRRSLLDYERDILGRQLPW